MAQINVNEVSQNYTYNIGNSSFCTVAMPITACWGPAYSPKSVSESETNYSTALDNVEWLRFPATQEGLEAFVATYRGPAENYRSAKDNSYQAAMTLLAAGYDILTCRLCPGSHAETVLKPFNSVDGISEAKIVEGVSLKLSAKYPGSFGNHLFFTLRKIVNTHAWNLVTYVVDSSDVKTAVENISFVFELDNATDSIYHVSEVVSNFFDFEVTGTMLDSYTFEECVSNGVPVGVDVKDAQVTGFKGTDRLPNTDDITASKYLEKALEYAKLRYSIVSNDPETCQYIVTLKALLDGNKVDKSRAAVIAYNEWIFTHCLDVYDLLVDKLAYNPNRIISPGWDDQNIDELLGEASGLRIGTISPIHAKLLEVAYNSRCGTALLDIPRSCPKAKVHDVTGDDSTCGYSQLLSSFLPENSAFETNVAMFSTNGALFAPWGQYKYVGTSKQAVASPSLLALLINRAMILNQSVQYEWILPTSRTHKLDIGKMDYKVSKQLLDKWQSTSGVGVNVITEVPGMGTVLWGNSTLFDVPPATYQALSNLSTRFLMNAVKDVIYRVGVNITFQYNNATAFSTFHAGVSPILDTMKNAGAIEDYLIKMSADINGLDQVNANSVIGKVYLIVNGVINDINVDLIAMPPGTDLTQFQG